MLDLEKASPEDFEELGKDLNFWLKRVKEIITKLESNGWDRSAGLYDLFYYKEITLEEAKKELKDLKISLKEIDLHEWEEE
tara:strand:- start:357 stop:599 length:243 start_codon:yes stop_codon:yes gene_type:complete